MGSPEPCVLVVDDDDDLREALADILRDVGYRVETAEDGRVALAHMQRCKPCLVLLDLMMPEMDGWEVADAMGADPELATVPVCIVTAQPNRAPKNAASVLAKPVKRLDVLRVVSEHCGEPPVGRE